MWDIVFFFLVHESSSTFTKGVYAEMGVIKTAGLNYLAPNHHLHLKQTNKQTNIVGLFLKEKMNKFPLKILIF